VTVLLLVFPVESNVTVVAAQTTDFYLNFIIDSIKLFDEEVKFKLIVFVIFKNVMII
jgi:hypothetical protein